MTSKSPYDNTEDFLCKQGLPLPDSFPEGMKLEGELFDPSKHLALENPSHIKDLDFKNVPFPFSSDEATVKRHLAYSRPFRVLSEAGVKAARTSLELHQDELMNTTHRAPKFIRGLGYVSNWHRAFAQSPPVLDIMSKIARDQLVPHNHGMNISHCNIGDIATGKAVDQWHTDSVDYVLVVILSDITDMKGGALQVLQKPDANNTKGTLFTTLQKEGIPEDLVETIKYSAGMPGYGILMQGSKILHRVTEVLAGREARMSLVMSYTPLRPFSIDRTRFHAHRDGFCDGEPIAVVEFARHKAWRVQGQMQYIIDNIKFGHSPADICKLFRAAEAELRQYSDSVEDKVTNTFEIVEQSDESVKEDVRQSKRAKPSI